MAFGNSHTTGLLPCLRLGPHRWWLPLSASATEVLGRVMLLSRPAAAAMPVEEEGQRATAGPISAPDWMLLSALEKQIQHDPPLLIYALLASSIDRIDVTALARWLLDHITQRFAAGDAFLGAPSLTPERRRRWRELDDYFRTLPVSRWCREATLWLEVTGPPVPASWREQWPAELDEESLSGPAGEAETPSDPSRSLLAVLARSVTHTHVLEDAFQDSLRRQKLSAIEQLAYGLSHEINNPLANISTRAQQLLVDEADASRAAMLQRIVDQVYRAHEMIADLMFYANPPTPRPERIDLGEAARTAAEGFRAEAERQAIRLQFDEGPMNTEVDADRNMIGEAIRVLIRNSIEAVGTQGTIVVRVDTNNDGPRVHVADSGPGLSEEARLHAFDPYFSGREAGRGLGLGLCRAYRIARLHSGDITLTSGPAGCVATLSLPSPHGLTEQMSE